MTIGLVQPGTSRGTLRHDDRLAEDDAAEDVADGAVRRPPHLLQAELLDPGLVRGDGGALDADAVPLDGVGGVDRDLVVGGVAVLDAQVVVLQLDVEVGQDQLLPDLLPDDPGHLVAVELDDRVVYLDLRHRPALLSGTRAQAVRAYCNRAGSPQPASTGRRNRAARTECRWNHRPMRTEPHPRVYHGHRPHRRRGCRSSSPARRRSRSATAAHWAARRPADPGSVTADGAVVAARSAASRSAHGDGPVTLVDAGIGPADAPAASWAPVPGRLPAELAAAGIDPADVDTVVLTHLHSDHIGWAVTGRRAAVLPERAASWCSAPSSTRRSAQPRAAGRPDRSPCAPPASCGRSTARPTSAPAVRLLPTPGHTPGHQSVLPDVGRTTDAGHRRPAGARGADSSTPTWRTPTRWTRTLARSSRRTAGTTRASVLATPHLAPPQAAPDASRPGPIASERDGASSISTDAGDL